MVAHGGNVHKRKHSFCEERTEYCVNDEALCPGHHWFVEEDFYEQQEAEPVGDGEDARVVREKGTATPDDDVRGAHRLPLACAEYTTSLHECCIVPTCVHLRPEGANGDLRIRIHTSQEIKLCGEVCAVTSVVCGIAAENVDRKGCSRPQLSEVEKKILSQILQVSQWKAMQRIR